MSQNYEQGKLNWPQELTGSDIGVFPENLQNQRELLVYDFSLKLVQALLDSGDLTIHKYGPQYPTQTNPAATSEDIEGVKADFTLKFMEGIVGKIPTEGPEDNDPRWQEIENSTNVFSQLAAEIHKRAKEREADISNKYSHEFADVLQIAEYYLHHDVPLPSSVRVGTIEELKDKKGKVVVEPDEFVYLKGEMAKKSPLTIIRKSLDHSGHVYMQGSNNASKLRINMQGDEMQSGGLKEILRRDKPVYILPQFVWFVGDDSLWADDIQAYVTGFVSFAYQIGTGGGRISAEDVYIRNRLYLCPESNPQKMRIVGIRACDIDGFVMAQLVDDRGDVENLGFQRVKIKKQV